MSKPNNPVFDAFEANCVPAQVVNLDKLRRHLEDACVNVPSAVQWTLPLALDKKAMFLLWWSGILPAGCFTHEDAVTVDNILKRGIENLMVLTTANPTQVRIATECSNYGYPLPPCST